MNLRLLSMIPFLKNFLPIPVEPTLNTNAYLGKWFQVATSRSTALLGTGTDYRNVTALYNISFVDTQWPKSVITVLNSGLKGNGNYTEIKGYSYTTGNLPTKRKLHFDGVPTDGNYWIVYLGPIINNEYAYAIVSGAITKVVGTRFSLYILARNVEEYRTHYESTVKQWCKDNGYTMWWNEYVSTI
jgi:lipocalin